MSLEHDEITDSITRFLAMRSDPRWDPTHRVLHGLMQLNLGLILIEEVLAEIALLSLHQEGIDDPAALPLLELGLATLNPELKPALAGIAYRDVRNDDQMDSNDRGTRETLRELLEMSLEPPSERELSLYRGFQEAIPMWKEYLNTRMAGQVPDEMGEEDQ